MGEMEESRASARKRVVVVAMKPQIRGRIRRNVMTFLDLGAEVIIVNSRPREDFLVGLEHPNLRAEFLDPRSLSTRYTDRVAEQNRRRRARWNAEKTREAEHGLRRRSSFWSSSLTSLALRPLTRFVTTRRGLRTHRLLLRLWRRTHRWFIRLGRGLRKERDAKIRAFLHRFHRINRFVEFWRLSSQHVHSLSPDLIVSSDLPGLVGANLAARRLRRPHLHDCHELYLESTSFRKFEKNLLQPIEALFMRRADSVVIVNQTIRDVYRRRYGVEGVVVRNCGPAVPKQLLNNPINLHSLLALPADARIVLYQGGLLPGRGLEVLIAATAGFPAGAHTVLVGSGRQRDELGRQVEELGLADRVHFIPAVLPQVLPRYTAGASVGVIPYQPVSGNNRMALPNKVFEYAGAGIPFAASDLPELRRIAEESGCAEVYSPFDPEGLSRAVTTILDPSEYGTYRRAAVTFGSRNTWEHESRMLLAEVERIAPVLTNGRRAASIPQS